MIILLLIRNANFQYNFISFQLKQILRNLTKPNTGENMVSRMPLKLLVEMYTEVTAWEIIWHYLIKLYILYDLAITHTHTQGETFVPSGDIHNNLSAVK